MCLYLSHLSRSWDICVPCRPHGLAACGAGLRLVLQVGKPGQVQHRPPPALRPRKLDLGWNLQSHDSATKSHGAKKLSQVFNAFSKTLRFKEVERATIAFCYRDLYLYDSRMLWRIDKELRGPSWLVCRCAVRFRCSPALGGKPTRAP